MKCFEFSVFLPCFFNAADAWWFIPGITLPPLLKQSPQLRAIVLIKSQSYDKASAVAIQSVVTAFQLIGEFKSRFVSDIRN